jgi:AcrR family transcriptional regulator
MQPKNGTIAEDPDKRAAILAQAIRTFAEVGFRGADVQVIADRAGVGKGTVYRYFGNKENLFWATTLEVLQRLEAELLIATKGQSAAVDKLRALARGYAAFFDANPQCLELFVQDRAEFRGAGPQSHRDYHGKLNNEFAQILVEGIASGELRPVDPNVTMSAFAAVMYGCVVLSCYMVGDRSLRGLMQHGIDTFLAGLVSNAGTNLAEANAEPVSVSTVGE